MSHEDEPWYEEMCQLIAHYKDIADEQWHKDDYQFGGPVDDVKPYDEGELEWIHRLLLARRDVPCSALANDAQRKLEMYKRLGLWMCFYWQRIPVPAEWDEVTAQAEHIGGYPGGAFYDKLGGDVYRFERRQRRKDIAGSRATDNGGVFVMAYTPIVMLPDENDLSHNPQLHISDPDSIEAIFCSEVEKLSCRYLRYQSWRYLSEGYPISYMVALNSLNEAIEIIAERQSELADSMTDPKPHSHVVEEIKRKSDERVRRFFGTANSNQLLAVVDSDLLRRRGLTSCILGKSFGVAANKPNRAGLPTSLCDWLGREAHRVEAAKLTQLRDDVCAASQSVAGDQVKVWRYDCTKTEHFSSYWTQTEILKENGIPADDSQGANVANAAVLGSALPTQETKTPQATDGGLLNSAITTDGSPA